MPRSAPGIPRKMLPPPTTTATSTPSSELAAATSSAMRCTTSASMPEPVAASANTSPESFSTTRSYLDASPTRLLCSRGDRRRLLGADLDPHEPHDRCLRAELAEQLPHRGLGLADERLLDENGVRVEAVERSVDDLRDGLLGLHFVSRERFEHRPLLLDDVRRDILPRHVERRGRRHVEGDVVRDLPGAGAGGVDAADLPQDADRAALVLDVLVPVDDPVGGLDAYDPTDRDVLAELGTELLDGVFDGAALEGLALEVAVALLGHQLRQRGDHAPEVGALGDEVSLAVQLDDRTDVTVHDHVDGAVLRFPSGALGRTGKALRAQPVLGAFDIAF